MKKITALLFLVCLTAGLTACGGQGEKVNNKTLKNPVADMEELQDNSTETEIEQVTGEEAQMVRTLAMDKAKYVLSQWDEELEQLLVQSKYSSITLGENEKEQYPELAETIVQLAVMQKKSMEEEFDNMTVNAGDMYAEGFETYRFSNDVQIRRADTVAVSILEASHTKLGSELEYWGMNGLNYDTQTGQQLKITDVITDMSKVPELVKAELNSHKWSADFFSETAVEDYFKAMSPEDLSWTLDYNGVTLYFSAGVFAEEGFGRSSATLTFEQYPELFQEKYKRVPEAYMVRMPVNASFFVNLDNDPDVEELEIWAGHEPGTDDYYDFGIYTDQDASYYYEELFAYDLNPYYVRTIDGRNYLYLFHEQEEALNRHMRLSVYEISYCEFEKIGEMDSGPYYRQV